MSLPLINNKTFQIKKKITMPKYKTIVKMWFKLKSNKKLYQSCKMWEVYMPLNNYTSLMHPQKVYMPLNHLEFLNHGI